MMFMHRVFMRFFQKKIYYLLIVMYYISPLSVIGIPPTLDKLPKPVLKLIVSHLKDPKDLKALEGTNRNFRELISQILPGTLPEALNLYTLKNQVDEIYFMDAKGHKWKPKELTIPINDLRKNNWKNTKQTQKLNEALYLVHIETVCPFPPNAPSPYNRCSQLITKFYSLLLKENSCF